jgi:hypothetical protein
MDEDKIKYVTSCFELYAAAKVNPSSVIDHVKGKPTAEGLALQKHLKDKYQTTAGDALKLMMDVLGELGYKALLDSNGSQTQKFLDILDGKVPGGFTLEKPAIQFFTPTP